jgi:hypothetical protein
MGGSRGPIPSSMAQGPCSFNALLDEEYIPRTARPQLEHQGDCTRSVDSETRLYVSGHGVNSSGIASVLDARKLLAPNSQSGVDAVCGPLVVCTIAASRVVPTLMRVFDPPRHRVRAAKTASDITTGLSF